MQIICKAQVSKISSNRVGISRLAKCFAPHGDDANT